MVVVMLSLAMVALVSLEIASYIAGMERRRS
jgi:hypothetical protein